MTIELKESGFSVAGATNMGLVRQNNEDNFSIVFYAERQLLLLVVIDGVGGEEGGEIAAELAKSELEKYFSSYTNGELSTLLLQGVCHVNNVIYEKRAALGYPSMSCVLTAVAISTDTGLAAMCHVGDTRMYHWHHGKIRKVSHDHSLVGYREEVGELTEEEAMNHPQRHVISRDIGSGRHSPIADEYFEVSSFAVQKGDKMLLCSDGLTDLVTLKDIDQVVNDDNYNTMQKIAVLIQHANNAGGRDNITAILVEDLSPSRAPDEAMYVEDEDNETKKQTDDDQKRPNAKPPVTSFRAMILSIAVGLATLILLYLKLRK